MSSGRPPAPRPAAGEAGSRTFLLVCGSIIAIGPLSIDMYLPAMASLQNDLHASAALGQAIQMMATPAKQQVRVDATCHRDGRHRSTRLQAAGHKITLELLAVLPAPTPRPYDLLVHDVHYQALMHTIAGVLDQALVLIGRVQDKRALRLRLPPGYRIGRIIVRNDDEVNEP